MANLGHILHLTVLNPARHTRIFYKLARSQVRLGWQVSIAGQDEATNPYREDGVTIYPIQPFHRLSPQRWLVRKKLSALALRLRPDVIVIHAPELLPLAIRLQAKTGAKLCYDVHEDFEQNLLHAVHYPSFLRMFLARRIRKIEQRSLPYLSAVSYAEALYQDILGAGEKAIVLENTFSRESLKATPSPGLPKGPYFLYCGTIAKEWGSFAAISYWEKLFEFTKIPLVLAGHCPRAEVLAELQTKIEESPLRDHIELIGGAAYVPYRDIVSLIEGCYVGFGLYEPLPHLVGKVPTKFYEFLALGRPLLYPAAWEAFGVANNLGVVVSESRDVAGIYQDLESWQALPESERASFFWSVEKAGEWMKKVFPESTSR